MTECPYYLGLCAPRGSVVGGDHRDVRRGGAGVLLYGNRLLHHLLRLLRLLHHSQGRGVTGALLLDREEWGGMN